MSSEILFESLAIIGGLIGLVWSADRFVAGAASLAFNFGMSAMMIGLTIVSIGTSAPEILVAISASLSGSGALAIGNAVGSNIANIGLVLAITALIAPIPIAKRIFNMEAPFLIAVTALTIFLLYDLELSRLDGVILLVLIPVFLWLVSRTDGVQDDGDIERTSTAKAVAWFILSLIVLVASAQILVWGAQGVARSFGISELIIGLTIVAVGTSLPELAASVASALKGHHDIALGNVIGSNIFNLLAVISVPGLIAPLAIEPSALSRDLMMMTALTLGLVAWCAVALKGKRKRVGRSFGIAALSCYIGYYFLLI